MYDYALTLGHEVKLFWRRGPPVSRVLMFCCRILVLMYLATTIVTTYFYLLFTTVSPCAAYEPSIEHPHFPRAQIEQ